MEAFYIGMIGMVIVALIVVLLVIVDEKIIKHKKSAH